MSSIFGGEDILGRSHDSPASRVLFRLPPADVGDVGSTERSRVEGSEEVRLFVSCMKFSFQVSRLERTSARTWLWRVF